jgi:AcrR family transcriptional regulator
MKDEILRTLLALASKEGLDAISLSRLATALSITKAALLYHYNSRDILIDSLFQWCNRLVKEEMEVIDLSGSALKVLSDAMDHWHGLYSEEPMRSFYRIIEREALVRPQAMQIKQSHSQMIQAQSRVLLETLASSGRLAIGDVDLATLTFTATVQHFLSALLYSHPAEIAWEEERFLTRFVALYDPS